MHRKVDGQSTAAATAIVSCKQRIYLMSGNIPKAYDEALLRRARIAEYVLDAVCPKLFEHRHASWSCVHD